MGHQQSAPHKTLLYLSRGFLAPLFIISLALHIFILMSPLPSTSKAASDDTPEEETPQKAVIDILSIANPTTEPLPPAAPSESQPAPPPANPQPAAALPPNPDKLPPPRTNSPEDFPPPEDPLRDQAIATPPPEPAFNPQESQRQFAANLGNMGVADYTDQLGLPSRSNFRNPGNADSFLANVDRNPAALSGSEARWLDKEPDTVLSENLVSVYGQAGIAFNELNPYGGERFFQALTPEGQTFLYLSLVQLKGSTLLVIWNSLPPGATL